MKLVGKCQGVNPEENKLKQVKEYIDRHIYCEQEGARLDQEIQACCERESFETAEKYQNQLDSFTAEMEGLLTKIKDLGYADISDAKKYVENSSYCKDTLNHYS